VALQPKAAGVSPRRSACDGHGREQRKAVDQVQEMAVAERSAPCRLKAVAGSLKRNASDGPACEQHSVALLDFAHLSFFNRPLKNLPESSTWESAHPAGSPRCWGELRVEPTFNQICRRSVVGPRAALSISPRRPGTQ
jgi:hypothetical protein